MTSDRQYFSFHEIDTRNAIFNFCVGHRSAGKTFAFKEKAIKNFLKRGEWFIYLRRHDSELDDRETFFQDIEQSGKWDKYEFKVNGYSAYIRERVEPIYDENGEDIAKPNKWKKFGFFRYLSTQQTRKGASYARVTIIGYDEFIIEDNPYLHYLRNEVKDLLSFWHTVDRRRNKVKVYFMSNAASVVNPFFTQYKITVRDLKEREFTVRANGRVIVQMYHNAKEEGEMKEEVLGDLAAGTDYLEYAAGNQFLDDTDLFIAKRTPGADYHYSIYYDGEYFSIYLDFEEGLFFVTDIVPKTHGRTFCLTRKDLTPNIMMIEKTSNLIKTLKKFYKRGCVFFNDARTRERFYEMLSTLNLR